MKLNKIVYLSFFLFAQTMLSQNFNVSKIEPPNWWAGMKKNNIQLLVYGSGLQNVSIRIEPDGIILKSIENISNSDYALVNITIPEDLKPQSYKIIFEKDGNKLSKDFPIYEREKGDLHQGFDCSDVIYLIMPDRFVNGDEANDNAKGFVDSLIAGKKDGRHGGDLQGIINSLDYLKEFGITSLWLTPVVENNTEMSYHGYGATDFYNIDPRLGTNELYKKLVNEAHKRDLKIIVDHVANHFNKTHVWTKNLPVPEWIHGTIENHKSADHNKMVFSDPYRDSISLRNISEGWFTNYLVDFNQANEYVKNYIIQNTIWWIEYSGLDGIREDTYPYSDQLFLAEWAKTILAEYPKINIVGEVWTGEPVYLSAFQKGKYARGFDSQLPSVTDFAVRDRLYEILKGDGSLFKFYETLTKDYLYTDANNLVTFFDNHDISRGLYYAKGDLQKMKLIYLLMLTTRGIPQLLYGSETTIQGGDSHDLLRFNFPGGFKGDSVDYLKAKNLSAEQQDYFNYIKNLLNLRKQYKALYLGNITHFPPQNDIYVYFKTSGTETFVVVANGNKEDQIVDLSGYPQITPSSKLYDVLSSTWVKDNSKVNLKSFSGSIFKME